MEYIFEDSNLKVLENLANADTLYAFDFDGTLSSIVTDYGDARARESVNHLMVQICKLAPVAIISGRSISDLNKLINFSPKFIIGNHGMEGVLSKDEMDLIENKCNEWKKSVIENFSSLFAKVGVEFEDKTYSFSLHYRKSQDPQEAERVIQEVIKFLPEEAGIISGKFVFNILSRPEINKGYAFKKILAAEKKKFSFFIGDDDTDEDIFNIKDPDCVTVRVEKSSQSNAKYYIKSQEEIDLLLSNILNFLKKKE